MFNFSFEFQNAWLMLLLIPAVALTFLYYFRLNKKYRKNRGERKNKNVITFYTAKA